MGRSIGWFCAPNPRRKSGFAWTGESEPFIFAVVHRSEDKMASEAPAAAPITRKDLETKILALAWKDDEFRAKFLADPKAQFEEKLAPSCPSRWS